jgi:hypothetical protein
VVTVISNKEAETVADAIVKELLSKFGIPTQIQTVGGNEFINKVLAEPFQLLNVLACPQFNAQVESFDSK